MFSYRQNFYETTWKISFVAVTRNSPEKKADGQKLSQITACGCSSSSFSLFCACCCCCCLMEFYQKLRPEVNASEETATSDQRPAASQRVKVCVCACALLRFACISQFKCRFKCMCVCVCGCVCLCKCMRILVFLLEKSVERRLSVCCACAKILPSHRKCHSLNWRFFFLATFDL